MSDVRRSALQKVLPASVFGLLLLGWGVMLPHGAEAFRNVKEGNPVPDFTLKSTKGEQVALASFKGKALILAFVREGQDKSERVLKALGSLEAGLAAKTQILAVLTGTPEAEAAAWAGKAAGSVPVLLDAAGDVYAKYGVLVAPATGVVKPDGTFLAEVASYSAGYKDEVEGLIKVALGQTTLEDLKAAATKPKEPEVSDQRKKAEREMDQALILVSRKMKDKALDSAKQAVATDETFGAAHTVLGRLLLDESDANADEALKHFERALQLSPKDMDAKAGVARVKAIKGDYDGAVAMLQDALKLNPKPERVYYQLGLVHEKAAKYDKAVEAYRKALEKLLDQ